MPMSRRFFQEERSKEGKENDPGMKVEKVIFFSCDFTVIIKYILNNIFLISKVVLYFRHKWTRRLASKTTKISSLSTAALAAAQKDYYLDDNGAYGGWKDVELSRRRSATLNVCSTVIARVIGRGGANINAIREATGASIEVEKQSH
uniref:KH_dom_type_1 domain-containing protein n=1 Tax=Heterorhabditis bacteriophora TaxID=37862 RepID=A0A1I7WM28_HETBA